MKVNNKMVSLLQVKGWLKAQHIHVHDEWVEACLDWLKSEHQGQALNDTNIKSMVYEQWLDSDLSDIASPILPDGINKQTKTELKGKYCLQMNYVEDVSESAYTQLQKVKGKENANVLVSATPATQSQYNAKSSRMLMLYLTDGHQSLQAMEYKPIQCLNTNLPPGTKVSIEGSITCRLGVLMLSAENIKVLGGEVDALVATNSQIQVLSRALSDEGRSSIPEHFRNRITTKPVTNDPEKCQVVPKQWKGNIPEVNRTAGTADDDFLMEDEDFNDDMLQEMKEIEMLERQHHQQEAEEWPDDIDDDLLQSIPDDIILPDVDLSVRQPVKINEHSMDTKPMATANQTVGSRSMITKASSYTSWSCSSNNTMKSNQSQPLKTSTNFTTSTQLMNKQTVKPQSEVAPRIDQSQLLPDSGLDHYSKRDVVKQESFEEVIMISDDEEENTNKCEKTKEDEVSSLQDSLRLTQGTFKIKGRFTTLITGLGYDSSGWKLAATVTDDGGETTLDVDLADKVLSKLIGFTVLEMMLMKKEMKSKKKEVAQRIKSGLAECQDALKKMHCGMTIRKELSKDHPCVVDVDYHKL